MNIVKDIILNEDTLGYKLRAKTGWGVMYDPEYQVSHGEVNISWWVGWVEKNDNVYIFANNLETGYAGIRFSKARIEITRKILKELNILP